MEDVFVADYANRNNFDNFCIEYCAFNKKTEGLCPSVYVF